MAYEPKNTTDQEIKLRADAAIAADSFNLTPDFFNKNKDIFERINDSISGIVKTYGYTNKQNSDIVNPLKAYNSILYNSLDRAQMQNQFLNTPPSNLSSGMRSISNEDTGENVEMDIINSFQKIVSESFSLMEEYRISVSLIPELKRVVKMIVRDILNANEITKRSIVDPYKPLDATDETQSDIKNINEIINKEITETYKIEEKLPIWLYEALVSGAKPILVLPYADVIKSALALSSSKNKNGNYSMENVNNMSLESLEQAIEDIDIMQLDKSIRHDIYTKKPTENGKWKYKSQEDLNNYKRSYETFVNNIIDDEYVDTFFNLGMEDLYQTYEMEKQIADTEYRDRSAMGVESDQSKIYETVDKIKSAIDHIENPKSEDEENDEKEKIEADKVKKQIKDKIRASLGEFVCKIDKNINIVEDGFSNLSLGKNSLFSKIKNNKNNKKMVDGIYVDKIEELESILGDKFDKDVILLELDPEFVIPISIGSQHVMYYIYEAGSYSGPMGSSVRKNSSFASIIASTGLGNDKATVNASNGVSITPNDPALSSVFNPASFGNFNIPLEGMSVGENNKRVEVLKQILFKTLSQRMCDPSLIENKTFKDSIVNLIREGYIVEREIKFTSVPATNVVYFAHDIDDKGMPHSIFDGSLLQIYMYLAGIVSMTLDIVKKSSDKEKLEVNMGMSKQIGMTLMEMQKQLSTRNIHVRSFFDNVGSVLRNVSTYARYTVPVVDGEKLYDVSQVENSTNSIIDTDFIEKRLSSVLSALPCPPAISNMINEAEFSRGLLNQSIEYRNSIIDRQTAFSSQISKLYRLLTLYSKLAAPNLVSLREISSSAATDNDKLRLINISYIKVLLTPPTYLNMVNINESFTNAEPVIESYAKYIFGEDTSDKLTSHMVQRFKNECIKIFAPNIDFSYAENIAKKIMDNPTEGLIDKIKNNIVAKKTENLIAGEIDEDGDGDTY